MAGLIRNEMAGQKPEAAPMPPEQPMQGQMQPGQEDQGGEEVDERFPEFISAMKFALKVLYQSGAADDIAKQLRASKNKQEGLANVAYEIVSVVDERTDGKVPRELIGLLAMAILNEIVDIAEAAKMDIQPQDAAGAFKDMLLRYLGENGVDTSQLQQGMDQIDPAVFSQAAA
jgi:hypothetical protein